MTYPIFIDAKSLIIKRTYKLVYAWPSSIMDMSTLLWKSCLTPDSNVVSTGSYASLLLYAWNPPPLASLRIFPPESPSYTPCRTPTREMSHPNVTETASFIPSLWSSHKHAPHKKHRIRPVKPSNTDIEAHR
ncbi:hypothetical protein SeMB42_g02592 [Synchytrium endobioticum]|uniref:Uncharacterized protein n=1 Tax=Synchytrium endobioticum TaxID=286115 RepID=A0A507DF36_9FUNG|nr:hypothetical protein SeMB42_g02592 [Synchytrium endobioticum]